MYTKTLDILKHFPKHAAYRKYTEQITNEKLDMVKAEPDVKKLEALLQGGEVEEVILQVKSIGHLMLGRLVLGLTCSLWLRETLGEI